jgi:hypothetical protein
MKTRLFKVFNLIAILIFIPAAVASGQITGTTSSDANRPQEVVQAEARFSQITNEAGKFFKQGLFNMQDNRRPQAGEDFNKAV